MSKELTGWVRIGMALLVAVVGAALFVFKSQASQDMTIQHNQSKIEAVEKTLNGNLETLSKNIIALSAQVSETHISIGKIETMQAVQGEDIRELKGAVEKLRDR